MKQRIWQKLIFSLKHHDCILVLGPELSSTLEEGQHSYIEPSRILASQLRKDLLEEDKKVNSESLVAITQQYEDSQDFGPIALRARASEFYETHPQEPSEIHELLAKLPFKTILTTRHDAAFESALISAGKNPQIGHYNMRGTMEHIQNLSYEHAVESPLLFRLFGDPKNPDSLVLSENDILDFVIAISSNRPRISTSLIQTLKKRGKTFLFVGFGLRDWYLRVLLKILMKTLEIETANSAIASESLLGISDSDKETTILFFRRGTRVEIEDNDSLSFLKEVSEKLSQSTGPVKHTSRPIQLIRVFISYAREDVEIAESVTTELLEAGFDVWIDKNKLVAGQKWDTAIENELQHTDFVLILLSESLYNKTDSYVNKEISLAIDRASRVRGEYIIPLRTDDLDPSKSITELNKYQELSLSSNSMKQDIKKIISTLKKSYQRRNR